MQNTVKSAEAFELLIDNEDDLAGLPDSAIQSAAHAAEEKGHEGKWLFTLDYPSFGPFMQYADNRELREQIWRAFASRAWNDEYDNCDNIKKIVSLRDERAKLLGYDTHAHYVLEERMAKSPDTVMDFLETLKKSYKPAAEKDLETLTAFAKDEHGIDDIQPWDVGYYSEKLRQKLFDFTLGRFPSLLPTDKGSGWLLQPFQQTFRSEIRRNR